MRYFKEVVSALLLTATLSMQGPCLASVALQQEEADQQAMLARQALQSLQSDCWASFITRSPELATFAGCEGEHGRWTDYSADAFAQASCDLASFRKRLSAIDRSFLAKPHQLQYDILQWMLDMEASSEAFFFKYLCLDQMNGFHLTIPMVLQIAALPGDAGYEALISRMRGVPLLVDQHIALLQEGIKQGIVPPKIVMRTVPEQILGQLTSDPKKSGFYQAFLNTENAQMQQEALSAIKECVYPAFEKLHRFTAEEYIPACRETIGMWQLPGGRAAYAHLVKQETTTHLTPQEIHQIGLAEVVRIQADMESVMQACGFDGTTHAFAQQLESHPDSYYATKEELLQGYRDLLATIEKGLPKLFNRFPSLPCSVVAVPEYAEASSIMAYYYPGSIETGRPGQFFVNTYELKDNPKWQMESLALHEALPGHHFQITLAQQANLPMIQKNSCTTAFVEGWGLYAESLGKELSLYQHPHSYFGRLCHEMLRALRLVVDTGIHDQGWSRDQAIAYYKRYLPVSDSEIVNEIDRYIVMPAQALAYKIGEITINGWRKRAQEKPGFDLRTFHDDLLQLGGCLPLEVANSYFAD